MAPKWIGFCLFLYSVGILVGWASTGQNLFQDANITAPVQGQMSFITSYETASWGTLATPVGWWNYFTNIWKVITLDFPIFHEGWWVIVRWLVLAPIVGTIIYGLISTFASLFQRTV